MPRGQGGGLGLVQADGTDQQHPTPLLKREMEEKKNRRIREEYSPWRNHVGITYIFITVSRTIFILEKEKEGGKEKRVWAGG